MAAVTAVPAVAVAASEEPADLLLLDHVLQESACFLCKPEHA